MRCECDANVMNAMNDRWFDSIYHPVRAAVNAVKRRNLSDRVPAIFVGSAIVNALIVFAALKGFGAPRLPVAIGCLWGVLVVYLIVHNLERRRDRAAKRKASDPFAS
jgi:hypothetical protein